MNNDSLRELLDAIAAEGYVFAPPTPETHRRVNGRSGNAQAANLRGIFGWSRPFHRGACSRRIYDLLCQADAIRSEGKLWKSRVRVASLNGRQYLHSAFPTEELDAVFFGPDTYRFIRAALASLPDRTYGRAIDLGCGSGAGGIEIAAVRDIGQLWLSDINPAALALARVNAAAAGQRARFVQSDLFAACDGAFDLILANPPYLADPAKRAYRDGGGVLGMELGLRIVRDGVDRLSAGGILFLYTGVPIIHGVDLFCIQVEQILSEHGFVMDYSEIDPDVFGEELETPAYWGVDRIAVVALKITQTGKPCAP
jgi:methylase of polypeptide subunit release factors